MGLLQFKNKYGSVKKGENDIKYLREIIEQDSQFLRSCGFMDYSVLLGIEYRGDDKARTPSALLR